MLAKLHAVIAFETETTIPIVHPKVTRINRFYVRGKQFFRWLNPKKWFSSLSDIDIEMGEFACKDHLPEKGKITENIL